MPRATSFDVGAEALADRGDLVDEADLGGQERVGGVLDHLGRAQVGADDRRLGFRFAVQAGDALDARRIGATKDDPIRAAESRRRPSLRAGTRDC